MANTKFPDLPFSISNEKSFAQYSLNLFRYQAENCAVYNSYITGLKIDYKDVTDIACLPFLPIEFFKQHKIVTGEFMEKMIFRSSGTTFGNRSSHYVKKLSLYEKSFLTAFNQFYGEISDYHILALLPNYVSQGDSSLVFMTNRLIELSKSEHSGFYLNNLKKLADKLKILDTGKRKILLLGVTYALLDLVELSNFKLNNTLVMETGGMKGRRKEMVREELHKTLCSGFGVDTIHSEYGMTEILSQSYSQGDGVFSSPPWMRILIRDTNDPFSYLPTGRIGGINVIDLANIYSCAFLSTQDLGKIHSNNSFEVLGRYDNSDIRGCNLLY